MSKTKENIQNSYSHGDLSDIQSYITVASRFRRKGVTKIPQILKALKLAQETTDSSIKQLEKLDANSEIYFLNTL